MTGDEHPSSAHDAADALAAYLVRVDIQLARAGMDRRERDSTCRQIVEQFHDLLPVRLENATTAQVEAALGSLSSDVAFASDDIVSRGQMLRMLWHRFWIGTSIPLALNDHGRKRVMWGGVDQKTGVFVPGRSVVQRGPKHDADGRIDVGLVCPPRRPPNRAGAGGHT